MPTPTGWREQLMDKFCVMFERAQDESYIDKLESFITHVEQETIRKCAEVARGNKLERCYACADFEVGPRQIVAFESHNKTCEDIASAIESINSIKE